MRTRAYRPEVSGCLEDRSLLSGVAGLSAHPVVLSQSRFYKVAEQVRLGFQLFSRDHDFDIIPDHIHGVVVWIPFGKVDGLNVTIDDTLDKLQQDLSAKVPNALNTARNDVLGAIRAEVKARVQAGDVVVR